MKMTKKTMLTRLAQYFYLFTLSALLAACGGTTSSGTRTQVSGSFGGTTATNTFANNTTAGSVAFTVQQKSSAE